MATDAVRHDPLSALPLECLPDIDHLVTEDNEPVDGVFSEKQMRLLTEPLLSSWPGPSDGRPFVAMANVGLFYSIRKPPLVPDAMLSIDVDLPENLFPKNAKSYFFWEYGKMPEVVVEVVSNRVGGEDSDKRAAYARIGILYYVIFDPERLLGDEIVRAFRLEGKQFERMPEPLWFPEVELGLQVWQGRHEKCDAAWLRWVDAQGAVVPTGSERAEAESARADRLAEKLRQLGVDPNEA